MNYTTAPSVRAHPGLLLLLLGFWAQTFVVGNSSAAPARGWLSWRGPQQNGSSLEKNLPDKLNVKEALWVSDFPGQSTPVIANGQLYIRDHGTLWCYDIKAGS